MFKEMGIVVVRKERKVIINGVEYKFPKGVKGENLCTVNDKVYIDGFELINGKWKKTLKAFWYKIN